MRIVLKRVSERVADRQGLKMECAVSRTEILRVKSVALRDATIC